VCALYLTVTGVGPWLYPVRIGHCFTFPILLGLVVTRARAAERGAAMSLFTALFDGGVLVGGPTLGALIRFADYPAIFTSAAALVATGAAVLAIWDRDR
jgi:predicted MFS family arabinose efflux permease